MNPFRGRRFTVLDPQSLETVRAVQDGANPQDGHRAASLGLVNQIRVALFRQAPIRSGGRKLLQTVLQLALFRIIEGGSRAAQQCAQDSLSLDVALQFGWIDRGFPGLSVTDGDDQKARKQRGYTRSDAPRCCRSSQRLLPPSYELILKSDEEA